MIILGHPWIESQLFRKVTTIEEIKKSSSLDVVFFQSLEEKTHTLIQYCQKNAITYALYVESIKDAIFANALGAKYILCQEKDAKKIQPIATEYLFDTSILVPIEDENDITALAREGLDGVIFRSAMV